MAATLFSVVNLVAIAGWVLLAVFPHRRWAEVASRWVIPGALAAVYVAIIAGSWGQSTGGFSSLEAVSQLFASRWMLLAGWIHYLAFDLFVGAWIVRDARDNGIAHALVLPLLLLTFLFGPAGWLGYIGVRAPARRRARGAALGSRSEGSTQEHTEQRVSELLACPPAPPGR